MSRNIRSIPPVEVSASSDVKAPVFHFREFVRSPQDPEYYRNNGSDIDFVTSNGSLYVPTTDHVVPCADNIDDTGQFLLVVRKGPQGQPGLKGDPGKNGRTPAVFARFDGRQMIFYTEKVDENGEIVRDPETGKPVTVRIAATNDLTGPSWKPKLVDETIVWEKTRDDEAPSSINLRDLIVQSDPVIFRVDSDNTKRTDETSGPANYIQWKYEGDEYWNNLISISELMNLTLAGVSIWFNESDQRWHFGHREVEHAYYDSTPTGKRIITDVELGEVLYDAGPLPESNYDLEIYQLGQDICDLKRRVEDIEEELPEFVKSVTVNGETHTPDENGNVVLPDYYTKEESDEKYQPKGDYIKKSDLRFEVRVEENGRFLYMSLDGGETYEKIMEATCACEKKVFYTVTIGTPTPANATMTVNNNPVEPGDTLKVEEGTEVCITAVAEGYENFERCYTINNDQTLTPILTPIEVKYRAYTTNNSGTGTVHMGTSTNPTTVTSEITNLSNGTRVYMRATRSGYQTISRSATIANADYEFVINTSDWIREVETFNIAEGTENNPFEICLSEGTHTFSVTPESNVKWFSNNQQYITIEENTGAATLVAVTPQYVIVRAQSTIDSSVEARCKVIIKDCTEPETTLSVNPSSLSFDENAGSQTFTVTTNAEDYTINETCEWVTTSKSGNTVTVSVSANTGDVRTCNITVTAGDKTKTVTVSQDAYEEPEPGTHKLTITSTTAPTGYSITVNGDSITLRNSSWSSVYTDGTPITVAASKNGWRTTIKQGNIIQTNPYNFTMTKDTSIEIIWEEETYSVTTSLDTTCGNDNKADHIYISKTSNVGTSTTISGLSGTNTIHVKATKNGYLDKTWTESVNEATTIKLKSNNGGCTWTPITTPCETTVNLIDTLSLTVGETFVFSNPVSTSGDCATTTATWSSSNPNVATVDDNGKVTGIAPGTTTITASANGVSDTCTVTITAAPCVVSNITITPSLSLIVGGTDGELNTHVTSTCDVNYDDIVYNSSNVSVASVIGGINETGVVIANGEGTAIVTATYNGVTSNQCLVTVGNPEPTDIPITGATFDKNKVSIVRTCGTNATEELTVIPVPADAKVNNVSWTIDNTNVATFSIKPQTNNRTVIITPGQMAGGTTTIRASVTGIDSNGQTVIKNAACTIEIVDSMIINTPSLPTASGDSSLYLLPLNSTYQLTTTTNPSNASVTWSIDGSASNSGISVSNSGLVTGTRVGAGIAIATNTTTGCHDNVRFQVYDEETITITRVDMESTGTDWIDGQICTTVSGHDTGYYLDYLIYPVDSNGSRPTSSTGEIDVNNDVAVGILNENCEGFNIDRSNLTKSYAYILVRDHFNSSIKAEEWVRVPEPIN